VILAPVGGVVNGRRLGSPMLRQKVHNLIAHLGLLRHGEEEQGKWGLISRVRCNDCRA